MMTLGIEAEEVDTQVIADRMAIDLGLSIPQTISQMELGRCRHIVFNHVSQIQTRRKPHQMRPLSRTKKQMLKIPLRPTANLLNLLLSFPKIPCEPYLTLKSINPEDLPEKLLAKNPVPRAM